eukprot:EST49504.1 Hypothetical protein SS50377_10102 [Spironucleus salmonicida]
MPVESVNARYAFRSRQIIQTRQFSQNNSQVTLKPVVHVYPKLHIQMTQKPISIDYLGYLNKFRTDFTKFNELIKITPSKPAKRVTIPMPIAQCRQPIIENQKPTKRNIPQKQVNKQADRPTVTQKLQTMDLDDILFL